MGNIATRDLTVGKPAKLIFFFAVPLLVGNVFQQFYSLVDTLIVGRTLGVNALAAVGCTTGISFFIIGFVQGLTAGFSIITAQKFGSGDMAQVKRSFAAGVVLCAGITVALTAFAVCFARPILLAMGTDHSIIDDAYAYIIIIYWGIAATMLFNITSNAMRALGESSIPLAFLVIASVINIVLDLAFIVVFGMGVAGAAVATVISQAISGALCLWCIQKKFPALRLGRQDFALSWRTVWEHLRIGLPMAFQASIIAIGGIMVQTAVNKLDVAAVAAYPTAMKIHSVAVQPMISFGTAMATYTAQNYGAGNLGRIREGIKQCSLMSLATSVALGGLIILFGRDITALFVGAGHEDVLGFAQIFFNIHCPLYFLLAMLFIFRYTLQGLGKSLIPTISGVMELVMRTFAAVYLASWLGFAGVCWADPFAWLGAGLPLAAAYIYEARKLAAKFPQ